MPVSEYYGDYGSNVMSGMQERYGAKKGKSVFYATANKRNTMPSHGIAEDTPELGAHARNRGDGPADQMTAHVYEERAKPRPGQPPFGPMTPGGKGATSMRSHLRGSDATDPKGWTRGLMANHATICKGM